MALEQVGPYRIVRELGRGAFGAVFLAQREGLVREVALKVLLPGADPVAQERFRREAKVASQLDHPNVVRCCDLGQDGKFHYLALDYVRGGSLQDRIKARGALPPEEAARLVAEVCDALEYAHAQGVLHRDLKPENVLLTPEGSAKLTDFGLAREESASRLTAEGLVVGTPNYFPPETLDASPASAASDIYAAALILYEALTARKAFPGRDFYEVTNAIRKGRYPAIGSLAPQVPGALVEACERGMALRPEARYESAQTFGAALRACLDAPERSSERRLGWVGLALGLVGLFLCTAALTAGAIHLVRGGRKSPSEVAEREGESPSETPSATLARPQATSAAPEPSLPRASLEERARAGDEAAAARLAAEAIAAWDHEGAQRWSRLAPGRRDELAAGVEAAEAREKELIEASRDRLRRFEDPRRELTRVRDGLTLHPKSLRLRAQEARLLTWVGRHREALASLEEGRCADYAPAAREVASKNLASKLPDLPLEASVHEPWLVFKGGHWELDGESVVGQGRGMGPYGLSGVISREAVPCGTGRYTVMADVCLEREELGKYGGLMILEDSENAFLAYLFNEPSAVNVDPRDPSPKRHHDVVALRMAYLIRGEWTPFMADVPYPYSRDGWYRLRIVLEGRKVKAWVGMSDPVEVPLPRGVRGRAAILKWYDHRIAYRNFRVEAG